MRRSDRLAAADGDRAGARGALPESARRAAARLGYRDFVLVALVVRAENIFPDTWLYVHDRGVRVGRIQNFNNWSAALNEARGTTCLGCEYFCSQGDALWSMSDESLVRLATDEVGRLGLARPGDIIDGAVVKVEKAYPVYDEHYGAAVEEIRAGLAGIRNLQVIGRNGMHKYNNQDHSMLTGLIAARRLGGDEHDPWRVNTDAEYIEESKIETMGDGRIRARIEQ